MKRLSIICLFLLAWAGTLFAQTLKSPDGNLTLQFRLSAEGTPVYSLQYKGKEVIKESKLGFSVRPDYQFDRNFTITDTQPPQRTVCGNEAKRNGMAIKLTLPPVR